MKKTAGRRNISTDLSTYDPATPASMTEGDKMPNYNELLTDAQIWDLVKFMKEGAFDVSQLYDATYTGTYPTGSASYANVGKGGNAANGNTLYSANCSSCHGSDGKLISMEGLSVGKFVRTKAYEVQHKVKYGQLGSAMVGEFDWNLAQMKDIYKALSDATAFPD
jgi:mono/diheme cytochrome c family protein